MLGGSDDHYYHGPLIYFPVADHGQWNVNLASVRIMGREYCGQSCQSTENCGERCKNTAFIDTGSSCIVGPADKVRQLNARLGAIPPLNPSGLYRLECDTVDLLPDVEFVLGVGVNSTCFTLSHKDYVIEINGQCYSAIYSRPDSVDWTLGDTFM